MKVFNYWIVFLLATVVLSCQEKKTAEAPGLYQGQKLDQSQVLTTIALGSCNRQGKPQILWPKISQHNPELWIWLGDNIYGDSEDMEVLKDKYLQQKSGENYTAFRQKTNIIGIWDDHDYGVNDGDKNYPKKEASKQLMLDFLDVPRDAPVRNREGAYQAYTFGPQGQRVKIILLDGRSFRDELTPNPSRDPRYYPNEEGDILGEAQWAWLEEELQNSDADINLIGCGIQIIPEEQIYEKWANFPAARQRFFDLLEKTRPNRPLLLSGDRHISELSKIQLDSLEYPVYEITSSGMTHTWSSGLGSTEPNQYRVGDLVVAKNYSTINIDWSGKVPQVTVQVHGEQDELYLNEKINWAID